MKRALVVFLSAALIAVPCSFARETVNCSKSIEVGEREFANHQWEQAAATFEQAAEEAKARGNKLAQSKALARIGDCYSDGLWKWARARQYYEDAYALAKEVLPSDSPCLLEYSSGLIDACQRLAIYQRACDVIQEDINLLEKILASPTDNRDLKLLRGRKYSLIAKIKNDQGRYDECHQYHDKAREIFRTLPDNNWLALEYQNEGVTFKRQGEFRDAEKLLKKAIDQRITNEGPSGQGVGPAVKRLGDLYAQVGRFYEAKQEYDRALKIFETTLEVGPNRTGHLYTGECWEALADLDLRIGSYETAYGALQRAIKILEEEHGPRHPRVFRGKLKLARYYEHRRNLAEAEAIYIDAVKVHSDTVGDAHPDSIDMRIALGDFFYRKGDLDKAFAEYTKSIQLAESNSELPKENSTLQSPSRSAATIAFGRSDFAVAEKYFKKAQSLASIKDSKGGREITDRLQEKLQTVEANLRHDLSWAIQHPSTTTIPKSKLIFATRLLANMDAASQEPVYSLVQAETLDGASTPALQKALFDALVSLQFEKVGASGKNWSAKAVAGLQKAKLTSPSAPADVGDKRLAADIFEIAVFVEAIEDGVVSKVTGDVLQEFLKRNVNEYGSRRLRELADCHRLTGQYARAKLAADIAVKVAKNMSDTSDAVLTRAQIALDYQDFDSAKLDAGLARATSRVADDVRLKAASRIYSAQVILVANSIDTRNDAEIAEALKYCREAYDLCKGLDEKDKTRLTALVLLGSLLSYTNEPALLNESKEKLDQAIAIMYDDQGSDFLLAHCYAALGGLMLRTGGNNHAVLGKAKDSFQKAYELHVRDRSFQGILNTSFDLNGLAIASFKRREEGEACEQTLRAARILDTYFQEVFPQLNFVQQCALAGQTADQIDYLLSYCSDPTSLPETFGYICRWQGILLDFFRQTAHRQNRNNLASAWTGRGDDQNPIALPNSVERDIREAAAKNIDPFKRLLAQGEAFVDVISYQNPAGGEDSNCYALISIGLDRQLTFRKLNREAVDKYVKQWLDAIVNQGPPSTAQDQSAGGNGIVPQSKRTRLARAEEAQRNLQALLWEPIVVASGRARKIWICVDELLGVFPLPVLYNEKRGSIVLVSEVDSPRQFISLRSSKPDQTASRVLLAGGINYHGLDSQLKYASEEIQQLKTLLNASDVLTLEKVQKEAILQRMPHCRIVHLATHGSYAGAETNTVGRGCKSWSRAPGQEDTALLAKAKNPLVQCRLVLSPVRNQGKTVRFGPYRRATMSAQDLVGLKLDKCDLVTLSACETGLGRTIAGQGVMGFRAAILGSGATSALLSLWTVNDNATCELMKLFYHFSKTKSKAEALQLAQQEIRNRVKPNWKDPYFWAGWKLAGKGW